jgi:fibronectin-binding autotransporter adhesin
MSIGVLIKLNSCFMKTRLLFGMMIGVLTLLSGELTAQTTYYSTGTGGNWNASASWSTVGHNSAVNAGTFPVAGDIARIGGSDAIVVPHNVTAAAATVIVGADGTTSTLTIGNNTNAGSSTINISGSLTVDTGGSVIVGGTINNAGRTATLNAASISLSNTFAGTGGALTLGNTSTQISTVATTGNIIIGSTSILSMGSLVSNNDANHVLNCGGSFTIDLGGTLRSGGNTGGAHTINLTNALGSLTNNGTINFATGTDAVAMNITASTSNSGTLTFGTNTGVKTFIGAVTNSGSWNSTVLTATGNLIFRQGVSSSTPGTFTAGGATFNDVTTNTQSIGGTGAMSFANVVTLTDGTIAGAMVVTNNNSNTLTIGALNVAAQLTGSVTAIFRQGANSTLSYNGTTIASLTLDAVTNSPNTVIYNANAATIYLTGLTSGTYNNLTYSGATTGTVGNVTISGNLTSNSGTFTSLAGTTVTFTGTSPVISGAGAFSLVNISMNTAGATNLAVNSTISVTGTISWAANGLLVVGSDANIILGTAAAITAPGTARYIQLDGAGGTNSNLIRITGANVTNWDFLFPIGTSTGGYTPLDLTNGGAAGIATAPTNNSSLSVKAIATGDMTDQLKRTFRMVVSGNNNSTTFTNGVFRYNNTTDISSGDTEAMYTNIWRLEAGGSWTNIQADLDATLNQFTVTGGSIATAALGTGTYYYTLGTAINNHKTWYSYADGFYNDFNIWTLDPSGTLYDNPLDQYPSFGDEIEILNGFEVEVNVSNQTLVSTTIHLGGTLDMNTTTGHFLGTITGAGLLKINGSTLPSGTYTDFVASTGGTIEFYDIGGNLPTTQTTYNKLRMTNSTGSNITYLLISNLTVNGTFDLTTTGAGTVTWQINNAANTARTITVNGDLTVASGGRITVGTGNEASATQHAVNLYGNFTNNGIVKFYDPLEEANEIRVANYGTTFGPLPDPAGDNIYTNELQGNAATVTFVGTTDNTVTCNNTTDFYRLVLNKGTGQQAMLTVNSSSTSNFRLFGPTDLGSDGSPTAPPNEYSLNSLSIINGTLQLTGSIFIYNLDLSTGNDYFSIPQNGALWLNGAGVTVNVANEDPSNNFLTKRLMLSGTIRVTAGTLDAGISAGIGSEDGGAYLQEGGTVRCWMFRPRAAGTGIFSFNMTGGTFNVGYGYALDAGYTNDDYSRFDLNSANSTFQMSGTAILNIAKPTNNNNGNGGIFRVGASVANYNVTGGTVNVYAGEETAGISYPSFINSTVPIYNLNIYEESATTQTTQLQTNSLVVLNNLSINTSNTPSFVTNNLNLTVGGNFTIQTGTTYTPGTGITTFNGTGAQSWTHDGTITALGSVVMNKASGILTLGGTQVFPNITAALTLTSGTLNDGGKTLTLSGTGVLSNSATHTGTGSINYTSTAATINGTGGTFGNLDINTGAGTIATAGNQTVSGTLRLVSNTTLNIGSNSLSALGNIYSNASPGAGVAFAVNKRIITSGLHNAGGLTRSGAARDGTNTLLFPVGTGALYTPNSITATATTYGTITVRPVASEHPNVTVTLQSVQYYWRVTSSGYVGISAPVTHSNYTFSSATKNGTLTSYRAARYDGALSTWSTSATPFNATGTTVIPTFTNSDLSISAVIDGEYTCGISTAFGGVLVYYSITNGVWSAGTTWSTAGHGGGPAAGPPCATCPVIIGDGSTFNHTVTNNADAQTCGSLTISTGSVLDCNTRLNLNFGTNTGGVVSGRGTVRINHTAFPAGDFTNFIGVSGGTVDWYGAAKTIPTTGPTPQFLNLGTYYNLRISPNAGADITMPPSNLTIYNDMIVAGADITGRAVNNVALLARTITINGGLLVTGGTFSLANNTAGTSTAFVITGNTTISSGAAITIQTTNAATHTITTSGSIINNGGLDLFGGATTRVANIIFTGTTTPVTLSGTNGLGADLSLVTVNKGTSQTAVVDFSMAGTITATNNTTAPWLTLTNGTFDFNNAGTYNIIAAGAGAVSFSIPPTAKLKVSAGTVNVLTAANDGADVFLNGSLQVTGGSLVIGNSANDNNNDIEYASAGTPTIAVSGAGSLYVNGSIRRSSSTITGALVYNQTGGVVTAGGRNSDAVNDRGVFEIDANAGSSFILTGTSVLNVQRQTNGTGYADLFINPLTSNVASTSTITIGLGVTGTVQNNLRINIAPSVGNFSVLNGGGVDVQTVNMFSNPLIVGGALTISTPSVLVTNSLDVSVAGNMLASGTYTSGTNTTTFNGTGAQAATLSGTSTFNNMTISKTAGTTVTLSGTSPVVQTLNILTGILDVGTLNLDVRKDITNNSTQTNTGGGSVVISSNAVGVSNSIFSSGGIFTNLTLGGTTANKTIAVTGDITINGLLTFSNAVTSRYLNIASNNLTFGSSAGAVVGAGATYLIRTNGVSSDLGVTRNWPTGTSTFIYPIGTSTNYTPVSYSLNVTTAGTLNVVPVNSAHPTRNQASTEEILNYYWIVTRGATLAATATGNHTYSYPSALMTCTTCTGTPLAGYLDGSADPLGWITSGHGGSATTSQMTFTNAFSTNLPSAGNYYDYSVGTINTLPNPILPLYSRSGNANVNNLAVGGAWTTAANWTTDSDGDPDDNNISAIAPVGVPVVIRNGDRINTQSNGRRAYRTTINGLLNNGTRTGHSFGTISGTGTFRTATNTFPAGTYTAFVAAGGGTIEYVAPMTMNSRTTYNNLSIQSGSVGTVTMANSNLVLNGNLTIPVGVTLNNANNNSISIAGNWSNDGTYTQGTGTVTVNGTAAQSMSGNNTFTGLVINKPTQNLTLSGSGSTSVTGNLTLTLGHIIASSTNSLQLGNATLTGGSASSFIAGPMCKNILAGVTFAAPLGSVSATTSPSERYRPATISNTNGTNGWCFEYFGANPTSGAFNNQSLNFPTLGSVSMFEYWVISRPGATVADVTLEYGTGSYIPPNIGVLANLRVARWDGSQWDLPPGATSNGHFSGDIFSGTIRATGVTDFSPFAPASTDDISPLPIELLSFTGRIIKEGVELQWKTASETNNDFFTVEKMFGNEKFGAIGTVKGAGNSTTVQAYKLLDSKPYQGLAYYRLKQTDFDGAFKYSNIISIDYSNGEMAVSIYPNPSFGEEITVEVSGIKDVQSMPISLYDQVGKKYSSGNIDVDSSGYGSKNFSVQELSNGIYTIKVGNFLRRVIITK